MMVGMDIVALCSQRQAPSICQAVQSCTCTRNSSCCPMGSHLEHYNHSQPILLSTPSLCLNSLIELNSKRRDDPSGANSKQFFARRLKRCCVGGWGHCAIISKKWIMYKGWKLRSDLGNLQTWCDSQYDWLSWPWGAEAFALPTDPL